MRQHCDAARRGAETPTKQASDSTPDSTRANQGSDALPAKPTTHSSQLTRLSQIRRAAFDFPSRSSDLGEGKFDNYF